MANATALDRETFTNHYASLKPLLLEEDPELDAKSLDAANDDPKKLIDLIAQKTDHTKAKVKRDLSEMTELVERHETNRLQHALDVLEERSQELATRFQEEIVPKAEKQMRENLWTSLLSALGLGVVIGLLLGVSRGR